MSKGGYKNSVYLIINFPFNKHFAFYFLNFVSAQIFPLYKIGKIKSFLCRRKIETIKIVGFGFVMCVLVL